MPTETETWTQFEMQSSAQWEQKDYQEVHAKSTVPHANMHKKGQLEGKIKKDNISQNSEQKLTTGPATAIQNNLLTRTKGQAARWCRRRSLGCKKDKRDAVGMSGVVRSEGAGGRREPRESERRIRL